MGRNDTSARAVIAGRRKYTPKERQFFGIDTAGRVVSLDACERLLRKIESFSADLHSASRYTLHFYDSSVCEAENIDSLIKHLKAQPENVQSFSIVYALGAKERYVVKSTTVAEMVVRVTDDIFRLSIQTERDVIDFSPLLDSLKQSINHLPKIYDAAIKERKKIVAVMALGVGMAFALLVSALPMLDERGRVFYRESIIMYLIVNLLLSIFIGGGIVAIFVIPMYNAFFLECYTDNEGVIAYRRKTVEQFVESSEVWLGSKKDFGKNRAALKGLYKKAKILLFVSVIVLLLMPIVIIWCF